MVSFYDFEVYDGKGELVRFDQFRGKVVLIVNVALLCGFTPQYNELQRLYETYEDLIVLGFPCNQFGNQEPMKEGEIITYCRRNFHVTFPIMRKVHVNGDLEAPLYTFLKHEKPGSLGFLGVKWNFEKFLIGPTGKVVARFESQTTPNQFEHYIKELLPASGDEINSSGDQINHKI